LPSMKIFDVNFESAISTKLEDVFVPEIFMSIVVMLFIIIFALVVHFKFKKALKNPMREQKGLVMVVSAITEKLENFVVETMGERNRTFAGLIMGVALYVFGAFFIGLLGLGSPMTYLGCTLSISLITFSLIHITAMRENKFKYFKRYIEPIPVFLPINMISMWAPLLSMSIRLFGNAVSGSCVMTIVYFGLKTLSASIFGSAFSGSYIANTLGATVSGAAGPAGMFFAPIAAPILHLYFDLFSGVIQTFVFMLLTMIFVLQEQNEVDETSVIKRETQIS